MLDADVIPAPPIERRRIAWPMKLLVGFGVLVTAAVAWDYVSPLFHEIHEKLNRPQAVLAWEGIELKLADGRRVPVPEVSELPSGSPTRFTDLLARGVEVTPEGRVVGLINIHHWCGNDPVRKHVARVDVSHFLIFNGLGKPSKALSSETLKCLKADGRFTPYGWDVGNYYRFKQWKELLDNGKLPLFADAR